MFWLILAVIVVVVGYVAFGNSRLAIRLRGVFNRKKDDVTNSIGRGADEHKERIREAESDLVEFKKDIANFTAEAKRLEREHDSHVAAAEKWGNLAKGAASAGNEDHVRQCISKQKDAERHAASVMSQIDRNKIALDRLNDQMGERSDLISDTKSKTALLEARESGNRMRKKMLESSAAFGGKDSLGDLDAYERQVQAEEDRLDALAGMDNSGDNLEKLYGSHGDSSVNDEVAALMKEANNV